MSCTIETVRTAARPRSRGRKTDAATERKKFLEQVGSKLTANESKSKNQYEIKPGVIRDCTRADPEFVWGDEGPIDEQRASGTY